MGHEHKSDSTSPSCDPCEQRCRFEPQNKVRLETTPEPTENTHAKIVSEWFTPAYNTLGWLSGEAIDCDVAALRAHIFGTLRDQVWSVERESTLACLIHNRERKRQHVTPALLAASDEGETVTEFIFLCNSSNIHFLLQKNRCSGD